MARRIGRGSRRKHRHKPRPQGSRSTETRTPTGSIPQIILSRMQKNRSSGFCAGKQGHIGGCGHLQNRVADLIANPKYRVRSVGLPVARESMFYRFRWINCAIRVLVVRSRASLTCFTLKVVVMRDVQCRELNLPYGPPRCHGCGWLYIVGFRCDS